MVNDAGYFKIKSFVTLLINFWGMTRSLEAYGVQLKTWYTYKAHLISVKPIPIFIEHL